MKNNIIAKISLVIYLLFFHVFFLVKKWTKYQFNRRKKIAINEAVSRNKSENKHIHVMQIEKKFIVGTREELRRYDKTGCKVVKKLGKCHLLDFDYRNAIIFTAR
jgi:hypothetical protein